MDALVLLASGLAAARIRFGAEFILPQLANLAQHPGFILYAVLVNWALAGTFDLYRPENWSTRDQLVARVALMALALPAAFALGTYVVPPWRFGRGLMALTVLMTVPVQGMLRGLYLVVAPGPRARRAVVIGDGPIVGALKEELGRRPKPPFEISAYLPAPTETSPPLPTDALVDADLIIVAQLTHEQTVDRLAALNFRGTTVIDAAGAYATLTGRIPVLQVDSRWFIATGDFSSLAASPFHRLQRLLDVIAASTLLVLSAPILLLASLAILVTSGPPILFRQTRLGRFRKPFTLFKLRTMPRGSEANGPTFAEPDDSRLNALGRVLRRWRMDELPQLVNVLRGEMSLVGPRPERPEVTDELERAIPFFAFRYSVRPGITGWAQVNHTYCSETEDHLVKLEYDLFSLRHHGPLMYLQVLLRTLGALVLRPGR